MDNQVTVESCRDVAWIGCQAEHENVSHGQQINMAGIFFVVFLTGAGNYSTLQNNWRMCVRC